jgi:hypothetical protein
MEAVREAFRDWVALNPGQGTEQWLRAMYPLRDDPMMLLTHGTEWEDIVQYVLRRVSLMERAGHAVYYHGISRPWIHPAHVDFWERLLSSGQSLGVVTMNYDILAEQALHRDDGAGKMPIFYYGGLPWGTKVRKMVNLAAEPGSKHRDVPLGQEIPIFKLHGSLNWAFEPHSYSMKVHDDVRAAFREHGVGVPAIIPPIEEKEMSPDFAAVWAAARRHLRDSDHWIVVGYSLPPYDFAVRRLMEEAAAEGAQKRVSILDPGSTGLTPRWALPNVTSVSALSELPTGVNEILL